MKEFLNLIKKRRSIRKFRDKKIPEEVVFEILKCGQRAPTACSFQTYSFMLIEEIERFLEEMNRDLKREKYYKKYTGRDIHYKEHLLRKTENEERNEFVERFIVEI